MPCVSAELRDCGRSSLRAFVVAWGVVIGCYCAPALGGTPEPTPDQDPQTQQSNVDGQSPDYNGEDFTRPQRSFETRFLYETSSGATSQTDRGTWLLRLNWRSQLGSGWKIGMLGQLPVVDKVDVLQPERHQPRIRHRRRRGPTRSSTRYRSALGFRIRRSPGRSDSRRFPGQW